MRLKWGHGVGHKPFKTQASCLMYHIHRWAVFQMRRNVRTLIDISRRESGAGSFRQEVPIIPKRSPREFVGM